MSTPPTRVVVCCGSGGVGKTTTSAALALRLAGEGKKVAVLTIDPARRLADSLGLAELDNTPQAVALDRVAPDATGQLDALMLDMKATFDGVVERFAPNPDLRDRILGNRYYQFASTRLAGSHEYMAMERLYELYEQGDYQVIVLDTPPTRHALDFLRAPERMGGLMREGVLRWLTLPRSGFGFKALEKGSQRVAAVLKRLVGDRTITEIADFFTLFADLWDGFRERSQKVSELLRESQTTFLLVTAAAPAARAEAQEFLAVLRESELPFGGFVVNRVSPTPSSAEPLPHSLFPPAPDSISAADWARIVDGVALASTRQARIAEAEAEWLKDLERHAGGAPMWAVPELDGDVHDLRALWEVASYLAGPAEAVSAPRSRS